MKTQLKSPSLNRLSRWSFLLLGITCLFGAARVHAGLTVDIHLYHYDGGYYFFPNLSTNTTPPNFPVGDYFIALPQVPANGSSLKYRATATSFD